MPPTCNTLQGSGQPNNAVLTRSSHSPWQTALDPDRTRSFALYVATARIVFDFLLDRGIVVSFGNPRHPPLLLVAREIGRAVPTTIRAPTSAGTWHARQRPSSI
jgi:hypothetical protein